MFAGVDAFGIDVWRGGAGDEAAAAHFGGAVDAEGFENGGGDVEQVGGIVDAVLWLRGSVAADGQWMMSGTCRVDW